MTGIAEKGIIKKLSKLFLPAPAVCYKRENGRDGIGEDRKEV